MDLRTVSPFSQGAPRYGLLHAPDHPIRSPEKPILRGFVEPPLRKVVRVATSRSRSDRSQTASVAHETVSQPALMAVK